MASGKKNADSRKIFLLSSSALVEWPPMMPASPIGPEASVMHSTVSSTSTLCSFRSVSRSPFLPKRTSMPPCSLSRSYTWSGRPSSSMTKLVTSTSAEIERWPDRARRCFIQSGTGAAALTLRITRPVKRPQPLAAEIVTGKRAALFAATGAIAGASNAAPAIAPVAAKSAARFPVTISAASGCGRFTGRVIRNVNAAAPVPDWMKQRLARSGQRSISALVDVTNFVMLELGRPLHVYDLDKLQGGIDVRFGRKGERLTLLNEQSVDVDETVLCITDASGPIGLAGIMGGHSTKAELDSRNIFLESAFFFPDAIAGRTRRYNFASDAAHRFERGVDFDNNVAGIERATELILAICGG